MDRSAMASDVVVVDDDARVLHVLHRVLERASIDVRVYLSPVAALDLVLHHPPAVLITDLRMPELDGIGLAAAVRGGLGMKSPRILLLTSDAGSVRAKDKHLFDLVLEKPWDNVALIGAVLPWVRDSIPPPMAATG